MKADIKFRGFDPSSGSDRIHASASAVDARGRTVCTIEVGVPNAAVFALGPQAKGRLRQWEDQLRELINTIVEDLPQ